MTDLIEKNILLAEHTTIGLGGAARYFARCDTVNKIIEALHFALDHKLRLHILSGGSNTIFSDDGFDGLVIKIDLQGVEFSDTSNNQVLVTAAAGESWDNFVTACVKHDLAGLECLSGIPGNVGGTPVQNVGAYGQAVSDTIASVHAVSLTDFKTTNFTNRDCRFGYRTSRFKTDDAGRYIITAITFSLIPGGAPVIAYPELVERIEEYKKTHPKTKQTTLSLIRDTVLNLREHKSMVINPQDPDSRSCGSFFTNYIATAEELQQIQNHYRANGGTEDIPTRPAEAGKYKISAAWLVEHGGFHKGYRRGNVGISHHHSLALVNYSGTTKELLALAKDIQDKVKNKFGITLTREPVLIE
ncbi:MAG: UDP-N-acetylmuramate dehydrogenase [bacterium]|nr:UDP-N-acetylmuramate dehydrogenase [bacterium]MDZ4345345.1 UDP-N-acetylmuramate dehydrogenase [Candidatus Binatia bacterium]